MKAYLIVLLDVIFSVDDTEVGIIAMLLNRKYINQM